MSTKLQNESLVQLAEQFSDRDELLNAIDQLLSEQKLSNQVLKEEFERLNVIIDLIPNTISWVNRDMTYFGVNQALAETCGFTPAEFVGKTIGFHTQETFFHEFVTELFKSSSNTFYRELVATIGGVEHTYLVSGTKLKDKDKAVVIGVDISELTQLKGHAAFTEKLATLGEIFAGIIHDINNPLMMIEGNVKRIRKRVNDEEVLDILNKIEMGSKKISKIVSGIKVYIRQDGEQPFEEEVFGKILEDATIICENKLKDKNVTLRIDPRLNDIKLNCHFTQIFQVFVNLISNSVDAINGLQEKWIDIGLIEDSTTPDILKIKFMDSGHGIPVEIQEKIFNAFFTTKGRGVGSGLGLSLCKKILEAHKGSLSIDNLADNTTFIISLKK